MNKMQVFKYEDNEVRTVEQGGEVWWVLADVCRVLGLTNSRMTKKQLDEDEKGVSQIYTPGGKQDVTIISESGLYKVILRSDKPEAKKFTRWVTHEVLPSIRQSGGYGNMAAAMKQMAESFTATMNSVLDRLDRLETRQYGEERAEAPIRRRPTSVISRLDVDTRQEVEAMICSGQFTYSEIAEHLSDCGIKISTTSVWRYAQNMN